MEQVTDKTALFLVKKEMTLDGKPVFYYNIAVLGDSLDPRLLGKMLTDVFSVTEVSGYES